MPSGDSPGGNRDTKGQPGITQAALFASCPRCGAKGLWDGPANFAPRCRSCGLDFVRHEAGGRIMALLVLVVAALLSALALGLDSLVRPPLWVHVLIWTPLVPLAVIGALRFAKAALLMARISKETER